MPIVGRPLAGKVALVSGGTRGIGAAISRKLAAWGCELYLNYVERDVPAQELAAELAGAGSKVQLVKADVSEPQEVARMFEAVRVGAGHLDILVHNAASSVFRTLRAATVAQWDYTFDTNARSLLLLAQAARPLLAGRSGRIIALSNRSAVHHVELNGLFGPAKAALEALVRSLAVELAAEGIVVNCVRPGLVATDVLKVRPDFVAALAREEQESPWRRATSVTDCANVVALLCLEEAAWIGGQTVVVDGSWSVFR